MAVAAHVLFAFGLRRCYYLDRLMWASSVLCWTAHGLSYSVQFLGELLLARAHVAVLVRYIADVQNLRLLMILLKVSSVVLLRGHNRRSCFWVRTCNERILF